MSHSNSSNSPMRRWVVVLLFAAYVAYLVSMSSDDRAAVSYLQGNRLSTPQWCTEGQNRCVGHVEQQVGSEWLVATVTLSCELTQRLGLIDHQFHGDALYGDLAAMLPQGDVLLVARSTGTWCSAAPSGKEDGPVLASPTLACVRTYQALRRSGTWRDIRFVDVMDAVHTEDACDGHYSNILEYPFASQPAELERWMALVDDVAIDTSTLGDEDKTTLRNLRALAHASSDGAVGGVVLNKQSVLRGPLESLRGALVPRNRLLDVVTTMADKERLWTLSPPMLHARISSVFHQREPMLLSSLVFLAEDMMYLPFPIQVPRFKALMTRLFQGISGGALEQHPNKETSDRTSLIVALLKVLAEKNIAPTLLIFPCEEGFAFRLDEIEWRTHQFVLSSLAQGGGHGDVDGDVLRRTTAVCLPAPFSGNDTTGTVKAALWGVHPASMDVVRRE